MMPKAEMDTRGQIDLFKKGQLRLLPSDIEPERKEDLDQWFTDPKLAQEFVDWSNIKPGDRVVEPTAGCGNLVKPLLKAGAEVHAYELDVEWVAYLRKHFPEATTYDACDFLKVLPPRLKNEPLFDVSVMNPPLSKGMDGVFLAHLGLRWAKRTCALIQTRTLHSIERRKMVWWNVRVLRLKFISDRPSFGRGSPMRDFSFVEIEPRVTPRTGPDEEDNAIVGFL